MPREVTLLRVVVVCPRDVTSERVAVHAILESVNRDSAHERGLHLDLAHWETDAYPDFDPQGPPRACIQSMSRHFIFKNIAACAAISMIPKSFGFLLSSNFLPF
jgi:hypothetical protein